MKNKLILMFVLSISFKNMPGMIFSTMSNENTSEDTFFSDDEDEIIHRGQRNSTK